MNSWIVSAITADDQRPGGGAGQRVEAQAALSLVISGRYSWIRAFDTPLRPLIDDLSRHVDANDRDWSLIEGILRAGLHPFVQQGVDQLLDVVADTSYDVDQRALAAVIASIGLSDLNEEIEALRVVDESRAMLIGPPNNADLADLLLSQQVYLRKLQLGRYQEAGEALVNSIELLGGRDHESRLNVSEVMPVDARRMIVSAVNDGIRQLRRLGLGQLAEELRTDADDSAVWASSDREVLDGLAEFMDERFKKEVVDSSIIHRSVSFRAQDQVERPLYGYALRCELVAHVHRLTDSYRLLGRARLLRNDADTGWRERSGLALLRKSNDVKSLEPALNKVVSLGPLEALDSEVSNIAKSDEYPITRTLLATLRVGAISVPESTAESLVRRLIDVSNAQWGRDLAGTFRVDDLAWKTILAIAREVSPLVDSIVAAAMLTAAELNDAVLFHTFASGVRRLDWGSIEPEVRNKWFTWAQRNLSGDPAVLALSVLPQIRATGVPGVEDSLLSAWSDRKDTQVAATILDLALDGYSRPLAIAGSEIRGVFRSSLTRTHDEASSGVHGFGGTDVCFASTLLSSEMSQFALWPEIVSFLQDPRVLIEQKERSLLWMSANIDAVPDEIVAELASGLALPDDMAAVRDIFDVGSAASILRFLCSANAISDTLAMRAYVQLSGSAAERHRNEAASVAFLVGSRSSNDFALGIVMQLVSDPAPVVQASAVRAMTQFYEQVDDGHKAMIELKLSELLRADGVTLPLNGLAGISMLSEDAVRKIVSRLRDIISDMARTSPVRRIRDAAARLLSA